MPPAPAGKLRRPVGEDVEAGATWSTFVLASNVCHAPALIPFGATRLTLRPIFHMCGFLGYGCAQYDIREESGWTDMLVRDADRARDLAQSLGDKPIVLMRGHGATVVAGSVIQAVHRTYYATVNAQLQAEAVKLGDPIYLEDEEARLSASAFLRWPP